MINEGEYRGIGDGCAGGMRNFARDLHWLREEVFADEQKDAHPQAVKFSHV